MKRKDTNVLMDNRYSILYILAFILMAIYAWLFDNTEEVSESDTVMVALPYFLILAVTAVIHWKKLLGTREDDKV